ncbi:MAG: methyltransferase domain-containing protein [Methylacidiphilaceae bacterium]|nr:methyltransferase domain-containing protein [Candidatus Methylacidiphilaceae bacterium]
MPNLRGRNANLLFAAALPLGSEGKVIGSELSLSDSIAEANARSYRDLARERYIEGAPHIRHGSLAKLYEGLLNDVFSHAARQTARPVVLDLGAGEGALTQKALALGATVTAVDVSESQLNQLRSECSECAARLETIQADGLSAIDLLRKEGKQFDVVTAISFLHHVPDYLGLLRQATALLAPHGQVLTFQDPMRYDSLPRWNKAFGRVSYVTWRLGQGDVFAGAMRYLRRRRGVYYDADNVEYLVVRNGVDQEAIARLFTELGLRSELMRYFSTQSPFWQRVGEQVGAVNTFSVRARMP